MAEYEMDEYEPLEHPIKEVPSAVVREAVNYTKGWKALDLGCGYGRNALFLAGRGYIVDCVDYSLPAVRHVWETAEERGFDKRIHAEMDDIARYRIRGAYDLVVCANALHTLKTEEACRLISEMQEHTNPEGVNAVSAFTKSGGLYRRMSGQHFFGTSELRDLYQDWRIVHYLEPVKQLKRRDEKGKPLINAVAQLVAVRPKTGLMLVS